MRLAAPSAGRCTSIITRVPREIGVRNRGSALDGLLAALIVDLARSHDGAGAGAEANRGPRVRIDAELGRRGLSIEVACTGAYLDPSSWRVALATELAAKLDVTLTPAAEASAYVVQFR